MAHRFLDIAQTPAVKAAQAANGSRASFARLDEGEETHDRLGPAEAAFIAGRDSFYVATVSETGWPYVQHRGGPPGFRRVLDERTLGFADYSGNRQYVTLGNLARNDRALLFPMDYAHRRRLKIYARVAPVDLRADPDLGERLSVPGYKARIERGLRFHVEAFDWNCPQHITPRFTDAEIAAALAPLRAHVAALEAENAALKARLALAPESSTG